MTRGLILAEHFAGEQLKISLQSVFSDARLTDSLLVIENVQDLPVSADEPTIIVACLASFLRSFPGVCVLCGACATESSHRLHPLLKRLLRFTLHLPAMGQKQVCNLPQRLQMPRHQTPNPKPQIPNPKPQTPNLKSQAPHSKP